MSTKIGDITLTKQTGTVLTLNTAGKYVNDDKYFDISVQEGAGTVTIASTDASIKTDSSNRNISDIVGNKSSTAPVSGYYLAIDASGSGSSAVTTAGWLAEGSIGTASATGSFYFSVAAAEAAISGTNIVTPSASISGSNITLSNTNNGISVTSTGGGTASATAVATSTSAGYVPAEATLDTQIIAAASQTTIASSYLAGVTIPKPQTGTNNFSVTVPNGDNDTLTLTFKVSPDGSWVLE